MESVKGDDLGQDRPPTTQMHQPLESSLEWSCSWKSVGHVMNLGTNRQKEGGEENAIQPQRASGGLCKKLGRGVPPSIFLHSRGILGKPWSHLGGIYYSLGR